MWAIFTTTTVARSSVRSFWEGQMRCSFTCSSVYSSIYFEYISHWPRWMCHSYSTRPNGGLHTIVYVADKCFITMVTHVETIKVHRPLPPIHTFHYCRLRNLRDIPANTHVDINSLCTGSTRSLWNKHLYAIDGGCIVAVGVDKK